MSGSDLSTRIAPGDLNMEPYTGMAPQMYRQLSPEYQKLMAPFMHKTTLTGSPRYILFYVFVKD
jgi:hypothetical protein